MTEKLLKGFTVFGSRVELYRSIDSTQKRARDIFKKKKEEALIMASSQTGGLGRRGKKWESPPGGLYLSVIIKDNPSSALPVSIKALLAAIEAFKNIENKSGAIKWKWPNDLIFDGGKAGGILSEKPENGWAIVGFGLNTGIGPGDLSPAVREIAAVC
ncbi:MAG: biotin--[acetyl-CoA-carboxylase] ligase, partial [Elusimicrobiota bacterium]|nr:biotin--[acetyl-CoA-carboxylase] ligase [Elusimicrobiota bacterium]